MEFFKPGVTYDFFKYRTHFVVTSVGLTLISLVLLIWPGPRFGIDFKGGTEVELQMKPGVTSSELRDAVLSLGFGSPDVIAVQGADNRYILRLEQISSVPQAQLDKARQGLAHEVGGEANITDFRLSPGGDKLAIQVGQTIAPEKISEVLRAAGMQVRDVAPFGQLQDMRYQAELVGVGDKLVNGLREKLGDKAPEQPLRVEWVGPKAGAQLRDAAINAVLYTIAFVMVYIAFRFDLRFAPGGVVALAHDALITLGLYVVLQKEVTLGTVAAVLTVIGYSINDTIVIYDRIRENMQRMRDATLAQLINVSTSQTLGRSVITSAMGLISILGFFIWGTPLIRDIVFALSTGFIVGTYSSIYVAAPLTEWMDRRFFRKA
ncbi:MAG TPA: protein translocase subunit SecF [Polyangiales bacterium]|nr:protein translocase subunit SecF [Polyangiales bacterium]